MAIFEFKCENCGVVVEVWSSPGVKPPKYCARCDSRLHKLISKTSFHLKGQTWAKDGYANKREEEKNV